MIQPVPLRSHSPLLDGTASTIQVSQSSPPWYSQYHSGLTVLSSMVQPVPKTPPVPPSVLPHRLPNVSWSQATSLSPFLSGRMFVRPNILRTLRRTMIRFLIEHLVRRIWFGQSRLYFILNWLVMRCKLRPELAADAQQTAWSKM